MILFNYGGERGEPMGKRKSTTKTRDTAGKRTDIKVRFEIYGTQILEKTVSPSGKSGRIYVPYDWVDHKVKVARVT